MPRHPYDPVAAARAPALGSGALSAVYCREEGVRPMPGSWRRTQPRLKVLPGRAPREPKCLSVEGGGEDDHHLYPEYSGQSATAVDVPAGTRLSPGGLRRIQPSAYTSMPSSWRLRDEVVIAQGCVHRLRDGGGNRARYLMEVIAKVIREVLRSTAGVVDRVG